RPERPGRPLDRRRGDHPALRGGGGGLRPDRLRRSGGAARRALADRPRPPLAAAGIRAHRGVPAAGRRRDRPAGGPGGRAAGRHRAGRGGGTVLHRTGPPAPAGVPVTGLLDRPPGRVPGRAPIRVGPVSGVWRVRLIAVLLVGAGLLVLVAAANLG